MAKSDMNGVTLALIFFLWYAFNAGYNVYNSNVKADFGFPFAIAAAQLAIGLIYAIPLWVLGIRPLPQLGTESFARLLPIALLNAAGHVATVCAMFEKGGASFTHVIKASEPVVSVILGLLVNFVVPKPLTALTLFPISYGVAYASTLGNLDLATMSRELASNAAIFAMTSNVAFALRSIMKKGLPSDFKEKTKLDAANEHAVTTILSLVLCLPFVLLYESPDVLLNAYAEVANKEVFLMNLAICGMCFYLYNEMQNIVLGQLGAVPTAVGNTLKRVVIFVALYLCIPGETFPFPKVVGCGIAIAGCLAFAIFDSKKM